MISGTNNYNENLTYDLRGNIQTLQRTGFYQNGSTCTYGQIDNLTYSYSPNTNRLHKVLDATTTPGDAKSRGFNGNLSTADGSMAYDKNGNLNKNLHKNVSTITYNHLNLPTVITFTSGNTIEFLYDAAGMKLRKTVKVGATVQYLQDYLPGGIEYRQNGTGVKRVEAVNHAEGRYYNTNVDASNTISWRREYNIKDHLGNTRLVFTDRNANGVVDITGTASTSDVLQENHYYSFGLAFEGAWLQNDAAARDNKYQYNGKEFNDDFGLNWNDYGARWYDAGIAVWNTIDPMVQKYYQFSPYVYGGNNPIKFIDPDGKDIIIGYKDKNGKERFYDYKKGSTYSGSNKFIKNFYKAVSYLEKHGASGLLDKLEGLKQKIKIRELKGEETSFFDFKTNSIRWNPTQGMFTNNYHSISATTILTHEADHAHRYYTNRKQSWKDVYTFDNKYDNKEEKRVITGSEVEVARKLGEVPAGARPRDDHAGMMMDFGGPTSTEVPASVVGEKKKN